MTVRFRSAISILPAIFSSKQPVTTKSLQPPNPISPSNFSITCLLQRCYTLKDLKSTYATMIMSNAHQDSFSMNQFLTACSRLRQMDFAFAAFTQMVDPNVFVYNAVIRGFIQSNEPIKALQLFVEMPKSTYLPPTCHTFSYLVKSCERASRCGVFGEAVHGQIRKMGFGREIILQTGLIDLYSSSCKVEETKRVFDEMGERDVLPWNSMIFALSWLGNLEEARRLFDEMPQKNVVSRNTMIRRKCKVC